jgi:hypothetical protein
MDIVTEASKKATAMLFTLLILAGVTMAVLYVVQRAAHEAVLVRDVPDGVQVQRQLVIDDVVQAVQYLPPEKAAFRGLASRDLSRLPAGYWHPHGPAGQLLRKFDWFRGPDNTYAADARLPASVAAQGGAIGAPLAQLAAMWSEPPLAVVQMKAGTIAAHARPFQIIDCYEPAKAVLELSQPAHGTPKFDFVRSARERGAWVRVFEGNERELLENAPRRFYHVLLVETARTGQPVAQDLLTKEALASYLEVIADQGVIALHLSNRDYQLAPVVADAALHHPLTYVLGLDGGGKYVGHFPSEWMALARSPAALRSLRDQPPGSGVHWTVPVPKQPGRWLWTDAGPNSTNGLERKP